MAMPATRDQAFMTKRPMKAAITIAAAALFL